MVVRRAASVGFVWLCCLGITQVVPAATPQDTLATLCVPEGFTVELVAAAPLVTHPLMAGFDPQGRLYVADNAGLNLSAEDLEKQLPNRVQRLEDSDGDGRFDRATTFADKMTFPQGALWFRGAVYVASPPYIWKLVDKNDDGVADERTPLVGQFGYIGNAADIHGCFVTPTGRIAWCDGRHGHEFKDTAGSTTSKGQAARIFTCLPDGSDVEVFAGGGMDNPVEVAYTREGEPIGTMTFYNPDEARHDALVHYVFGGVYPRKHPCTAEFPSTGPLMPSLSLFGVVAPSGLTRQDNVAWGDDYLDDFFSAQFNTHQIVRHTLARHGATYTSTDEPFLTSTSADFHPTDVLVDADGSLLVIDTGGWFRIGCPTSQIAKPEIGGAIYRIRKNTAQSFDDPRGLKIDWESTSDTEIADLFSDPRPVVVEQAIEFLVPRGDAAMGALATALFEGDYRSRQNAMWALARINTENSRLLLRQALSDDDIPGRVAAVNAVGDIRDRESILAVIDRMLNDEPPVRREAATALARLKNAEAVPSILKALSRPVDRFEEHALIFALIEINDRSSTLAGLSDENPAARRAALLALDQMAAGNLTRDDLIPLLASDDPVLLNTVIEVLGRHPQWAEDFDRILVQWLQRESPTAEQLETLRGAVTALAGRETVQKLVAKALVASRTESAVMTALLEALSTADLEETTIFEPGLISALGRKDDGLLRTAIFAATSLAPGRLAAPLMSVGLDASHSSDVRLAALRAAASSEQQLPKVAFALLVEQLDREDSLADRLAASESLGKFKLDSAQRIQLVPYIRQASPLELPWLLSAYAGDRDAGTGIALLGALAESSAKATLGERQLREVIKGYPAAVHRLADELLKELAPQDTNRATALAATLQSLPAGDPNRGRELFFDQKAACAACHRAGSKGEKIGPDLTTIGSIRNRRDLAEAILFPEASLARGYESYSIVTRSGQVQSGIVERQTPAAIFIRTSNRAQLRIARDEIDEMLPSPTSIMPQGLGKSLSPAELADVIAFLESLKS
jgi:putative membrane-bound dehydrogenase-like protein